ncbi:OsmC family protein [Membranihabitans maritimus]|uniref:OsmC family protein n=1 Tax=Membranihabitans maritimus TaxID=2904244 RepID=UPI001F28A691|nr:OsmC family protein [Membranihabitans maritimus]
MAKTHQFNSHVIWTGNRGSGTMDYRAYDRDYEVKINGKPTIMGSSDSVFSGNDSMHNPQDFLVSAVSSCHMLWYLHLCATNGVIVLEYEDNANGEMKVEVGGHGQFTKIDLYPRVLIARESEDQIELAKTLHDEARNMCFIANSLNFPVEHEVEIRTP